jgi:hypothetical protein
MDKPRSMSVKDYLVRILSVRMNVAKSTVEAIVDFQMQEANKALVHSNSIEISGFGKLFYNKKKAQKKLDHGLMKEAYFTKALTEPNLTELKTQSLKLKLENTIKTIESIKPKLHGIQQDTGRLEEQVNSLINSKGLDRGSIPAED